MFCYTPTKETENIFKGKCPHLIGEEDHNKTTIYPKCSCNRVWCHIYKDYDCPIKD